MERRLKERILWEISCDKMSAGGYLGKAAVASIVAGLLTFGGVAYSPVLAANNTAGSGAGVAIGTGSNAPKNENVAIGKGAVISYSNGASTATGDIVVGNGASINNYASQGGSIAIGKNAKVENMAGGGEASFAFGQTTFSGSWLSSSRIPADPSKVIGSIAIGDNTFARTGSTMIGSHNYKGELGDTTVDSTSTRTYALNVYATTIGANSFSNGAFTTNTGSYNIISSNYDGGRLANPVKNMGATITGALNSIESIKGAGYYSGIANTVSGIANRTSNSNGTLIYGAGNEVTNSITSLNGTPEDSGNSAKAFSEKLRNAIKESNSGGATLVIGGANVADYTQKTQIIGVNNKVTGTSDKISDYNMINGYGITVTGASHLYTIGTNNTITNAKNTILFGDNRKAEGVENSVIIGNADKETSITIEKKDTVIVGHNANATVDGGVALGAGSVASREAGVAGYDPATKTDSTDSSATWKATDAAVSVGKADGTMTRQITGVAAGTEATDAVNVAQLQKALAGAKDSNDTLQAGKNALTLNGNTLSMSVKDTAGNEVSGSVDLTRFAQAVDTNTTYTLTGEANPDNNTTTITLKDSNGRENSVTVATKDTDTRNTVKAGENVTLDTKDNADGSHEYTVHVKADGKVEAGSTKIVSGGTVYNETRVAQDGTYVKASNTAGENLSALDKQVASNTGAIRGLDGRVSKLDSRLNKVGAGAAALAALHPQDFNPDDKWDFAVGFGNYRDANAMALGAFYRPDDRTMFSVAGNFGNGENMVNAGISVKLGKNSPYAGMDRQAMIHRLASQDRELEVQNQRIAKLEQLVAQLMAK